MQPKTSIRRLLSIALLVVLFHPLFSGLAAKPLFKTAESGVTAYNLIAAMNTLRVSNGYPALVEDPIINAVAQSTAEIMAANQMSWHIGNVSGRLASAGYGGGAKVWATENFAVGINQSIDEIMLVWADASHMLPATNGAYCNIGAGVATSSNGRTYYVLQAAYVAGKACGEYTSGSGSNNSGSSSGSQPIVPQIIIPVKVATPDADGKIFHEVKAGQSFWSIAIAYKVTIKDIETWNNISRDTKLQVGQRLFIPSSNTEGYATPTPVGMVQVSTPDKDGKIIHTVQAYQTLTTISKAYETDIQTILNLNGIQADWPLQIEQKLVIYPGNITPSPTPRPLTPLEKLTPESDGKYYHVVSSGETLSWIAALYEIRLTDLMNWNGLNGSSIIVPGQKLVLQVTPPVTETPTPGPPTITPTRTPVPDTATPTPSPTRPASSPSVTGQPDAATGSNSAVWFIPIGLAAGGLFLVIFFYRKKT
jgi:LPXTG-motif cell wall-anchored protein